MNNAGMPLPRAEAYGLVRDPQGRPKVDGNPHDLPVEIKMMLTDSDWQYLENKHGNS